MSDSRYDFIIEWYDMAASLIRTYNFIYFLSDKTIELVFLGLKVRSQKQQNILKKMSIPSNNPKRLVYWLSNYSLQQATQNCRLCRCLHQEIVRK